MFERQKRLGLLVYLYYNRDAKKLSQYGDKIYHSKKMRYLLLYVNAEGAEQILAEISQLNYVKTVLPSYFTDINQEFVGNLQE
ncbi:DUF2129 domain-containing protein [Streptococcus sp. sy010]|uniref:DUF2129 domain-containing protein n=1 Tax=Streptococcus sp. sy010 TaxID=2600148 RepID=UPI0011B6B464|nr:DUF2129 domain-containing protein [Streptococcus sp. sy010]TWT14224.1 DUF2129 domain-containing protein [Streptococcus sp. sy010]